MKKEHGLNWYYFGAHYYDPAIGRWLEHSGSLDLSGLSVDPLADKYSSFSPYIYVLNNPINRVDPTGEWSIVVVVKNDRTANLILFDLNGKYVKSYSALAKGVTRNRMITNGDTPHGLYKITGWIVPGKNQPASRRRSYGPNPRLKIKGIKGEAKESGRTLLRVHGGDKSENGKLRPTHGCIRLSNEDIKDLFDSVKTLEKKNEKEKPENLEVITKSDYENRKKLKIILINNRNIIMNKWALLIKFFIIFFFLKFNSIDAQINFKSNYLNESNTRFNYKKLKEYHLKYGYKYEIADSDFIEVNIIKINNNILLIPVEDISVNYLKAEKDIYLVINDSIYTLKKIKGSRKGQLNYLGNDNERIYFVFNCFVDNIKDVKIVSDSPLYCHLFKYSELWVFSLKNYKLFKIDTDDGEYQNLKIQDKYIEVEVFPKYKKQLYFNNLKK